MTLAEKLRILRKNQKLNQTKVATVLKISQQAYAKYELGATEPDIESLKNLANFYGVSIDELLGNKNENALIVAEQQSQTLTVDQAKDLWLNSLDPEDKTTITMFLDLDFKNKLKVQGYIMSLRGQVTI